MKAETKSLPLTGSTSTLLPVLATSHASTDTAAAMFPTTHFAVVGSDGRSGTDNQRPVHTSSSTTSSEFPLESSTSLQAPNNALSTSGASLSGYGNAATDGKVLYHQVNDDHIPIPPIFFPNPARHVPHHVHVPKHPIHGTEH